MENQHTEIMPYTSETQGKTPNPMITNTQSSDTNTQNNPITNPYRQADVLDQARLRPHSTVLRYNCEGKIVNLLLNLQSRGKADLTVKFVAERLKYFAKYVNLDDSEAVDFFIARKQCLDSHKDGLVKAYNHYAQFYGIKYVKPKFRCSARFKK